LDKAVDIVFSEQKGEPAVPTRLPGAGFVQKNTSAAAGTATCTTQVAVVVMVVMLAFNAAEVARSPAPMRWGVGLIGLIEWVGMGLSICAGEKPISAAHFWTPHAKTRNSYFGFRIKLHQTSRITQRNS
jgi:hypothetical protein